MRSCLILIALIAATACPKKDKVADAGAPVVDDKATDGISPILEDKGPPDPRAARLCNALHGFVAERKAACCEEKGGKSPLEATCVSTVSAALKGKSVAFDDDKLATCEAAQGQALADCGWVRTLAPDTPSACKDLFSGTLDEGARCRSSVECKSGLRCHGASPLDAGRCGKPRPVGAPCGAAIDALSIVVPQTEIDKAHPECNGLCVLGKCHPILEEGGKCRSRSECGDGNRCEEGVCKKGLLAIGEACKGLGCVEGARCIDGKCAPRAKEGEACGNDFDCERGGCVKPAGAKPTDKGICGKQCPGGAR